MSWPKIVKSADTQMRRPWEFGSFLYVGFSFGRSPQKSLYLFTADIIWGVSNDNSFTVGWICPLVNSSGFLSALRTEWRLSPALSYSRALRFLSGTTSRTPVFAGEPLSVVFQGQSWPKLWCVLQHAPPCLSSSLLLSPSPCLVSMALSSLAPVICAPLLCGVLWRAQACLYFQDPARRESNALKLPFWRLTPSRLQNSLKVNSSSMTLFLRLFGVYIRGRITAEVKQGHKRVDPAQGTWQGHCSSARPWAGGCSDLGKSLQRSVGNSSVSQGCRVLIDICVSGSGWSRGLKEVDFKACVWWMGNWQFSCRLYFLPMSLSLPPFPFWPLDVPRSVTLGHPEKEKTYSIVPSYPCDGAWKDIGG